MVPYLEHIIFVEERTDTPLHDKLLEQYLRAVTAQVKDQGGGGDGGPEGAKKRQKEKELSPVRVPSLPTFLLLCFLLAANPPQEEKTLLNFLKASSHYNADTALKRLDETDFALAKVRAAMWLPPCSGVTAGTSRRLRC